MLQVQNWALEELPGALRLKCWTQAPREVLTLRSLDQESPGELRSRVKACLLGQISEQSWRLWWADVITESWSRRKPEHSKRSKEKRDQWVQVEQGHQGQVRADRYMLCLPRYLTARGHSILGSCQCVGGYYLYCFGHRIKWSRVIFTPQATDSTETFPSRTLWTASWQLGSRTGMNKAGPAISGGNVGLTTSAPPCWSQGSPVARNSHTAWSEQGTRKGQVRQRPEAGSRSKEPW